MGSGRRALKSAKLGARSAKRDIGQTDGGKLAPIRDEYAELEIKEDLDEDDSFYDKMDRKI